MPPKISAISINGKRAYQLARAGTEFEMAPRAVVITSYSIHYTKLYEQKYAVEISDILMYSE